MYLTLRAKLVGELKSMLSGSLFHAFKTRCKFDSLKILIIFYSCIIAGLYLTLCLLVSGY